MTISFLSKEVIYAFDNQAQPALTVPNGATVTIATYDCFEDQVQDAQTPITEIDWNRINPASGPIFIEEAQPGDVLQVHIQKIMLDKQGVLATGPNLGVMGHRLKEMETKIIPIQKDQSEILYAKIFPKTNFSLIYGTFFSGMSFGAKMSQF